MVRSTRGMEALTTTRNQSGFSLIVMIGVLAVMSIMAAVLVPNLIRSFDILTRDTALQNLKAIARGVELSLRENRAWPTTLASLSPEYVPFGSAQLTQNDRGYPRYYFAHPTTSGFNNATGIAASALPDTRFLLISDLSQDAAPTITTASEFETWWNTDETSTPDLKIYRGNVASMFHQLTLSVVSTGAGGSYEIDASVTDSLPPPLPPHSNYHVVGTVVGLDEDQTYTTPEIEFALLAGAAYQYDKNCPANQEWNVLGSGC